MKNYPLILLFVVFVAPMLALAQQFKPAVVNPFGINKIYDITGFCMGDMNHDNLPDLLYRTPSTNNIVINQGSLGYPNFIASPILNYLDENNGYGKGSPISFRQRMVDFDNDQDLDDLDNSFSVFGEPVGHYSVQLNQPELVPANNYDFFFQGETDLTSYGIPLLGNYNVSNFDYRDITGDGLADILAMRWTVIMGTQFYGFMFYKRLTATSFEAPVINPFGLNGSYFYSKMAQPCLIDADQDGDQDLLILDPGGNWIYYQNNGSAQAPHFSNYVVNPFGLTALPEYSHIAFVMDINQDGIDDLLAASNSDFYYYEAIPNVSVVETPEVRNVQVFPILVHDKCQVSVTGNLALDKILISDLRGNVKILGATQEIDFQSFAPGVYFVTVVMEDGSRFSQKVVKARD